MQGCFVVIALFVVLVLVDILWAPVLLIGTFYTEVVGSDGWDVFIIILSLVCGYFVYCTAASEDTDDGGESHE